MSDAVAGWQAVAVAGAAVSGLVTLAWRRNDLGSASRWHAVVVTAMGLSLVAPLLAALVGPHVLVILYHPGSRALVTAAATLPTLITPLVWIYGGVALILMLRFAAGWMELLRLRRESVPLAIGALGLDPPAVAAASVRMHPRVKCPLTFGWRRPVVLMPAAAATWSSDRMRAVLLHEIAHVRRLDVLWNALATLYVAAFWLSPFAWQLRRLARLAAELSCDRAAVAEVGFSTYARALVDSARDLSHASPSHGRIAPGAETDLYARLEVLLDSRPRMKTRSLFVTVVGAMLVGATVVAAPSLRVRITTSPPLVDHPALWLHDHRHQVVGQVRQGVDWRPAARTN